MSCDWSTRLDSFIDGELSPARTAEVETHLSRCDDCRADLASLSRMSQAFGEYFDDAADRARQRMPLLTARINAAAAAPLAAAAWHYRESRQIARLSRFVAAAAAIVVVAGIGWLQLAPAPAAPNPTLDTPGILSVNYEANRDQPEAIADFVVADLGTSHTPAGQ